MPFLPLLFTFFCSFSSTHPHLVPIFIFSLSRPLAHPWKSCFVLPIVIYWYRQNHFHDLICQIFSFSFTSPQPLRILVMIFWPTRCSLSPRFLLCCCSGLRSGYSAIWVGEQRWAEHPGNDRRAASQILGDYQCTERDHRPDGVWLEFARIKWVWLYTSLRGVCGCVFVAPGQVLEEREDERLAMTF